MGDGGKWSSKCGAVDRLTIGRRLTSCPTRGRVLGIATLIVAANCYSQTPERWNLFYQATSIGQNHGSFFSLYEGPNSLSPQPENRVSLTTTLFFGLRLATNTRLYFDPEIAGGKGFSDVTGIANFPNGEIPRVDTATPKPYLARLYVTQDFGFGSEKEQVSSGENQLAGERPLIRYSVTVGRFTVTDFFDNNRYSHDPRTQFMGWAVMYNGAWDYPADVRGYTWGWVHEFHAGTGRCGTAMRRSPESPTAFGLTTGSCGTTLTSSRGKSATTCELIQARYGCSGLCTTQIPARMPMPYGWASRRARLPISRRRAGTGR